MTDTRYEANEQDVLDRVFDNVKEDDPSDEILEEAIGKGIESALTELKRHLTKNIKRLKKEAREIFDSCLGEDDEATFL